MDKKHKIPAAVIIVAAGASSRMGKGVRKQYRPLGCGTVLSESVKPFLKALDCASLVIAIPSDEDGALARDALYADTEIETLLQKTKPVFVRGGATRQASVKIALEKTGEKITGGIVLIHDAARPFVTEQIIVRTAQAAIEHGGAVPAVLPTDTQKIINAEGFIVEHLKRERMAAVQTPQAFDFIRLLASHRKAENDGEAYTDDTEIWGKYEGDVMTVQGSPENKKITYTEDIRMTAFRTGLGYDMHRLIPGRKLMIGGVVIPFDKGEDAHSDGDVLLHAVTDALLGAAALGDIGSFFPPEDAAWKDADSVFLLKSVWKKIQKHGWHLINMDCVIKLERPKFLPYRRQVIDSIARALGVESSSIFVKAKTGEALGDVGKGEAVEAWCTCFLGKN